MRKWFMIAWLAAALAPGAAAEEPAWKAELAAAREAMNAGNLEKAEAQLELARRAASITGDLDGDLAFAYETLAERYRRSGGLEAALARLDDAIEIWTEVIGASQPKLAALITEKARLYEKAGEWREAESHYRKAVSVLESCYSESDPAVAAALGRLAEHLAARGRLDEAGRAYGRARAILDEAFGPLSPELAASLEGYVGPLLAVSRYTQALDLEAAARRTGRLPARIGRGVRPPMLKSKDEPSFTEAARERRLQGKVTLAMVVGETGAPAAIWVTQPLGLGLDEEAVKAVSRWRFDPGTKDGQPVPVITAVEVNLRLL